MIDTIMECQKCSLYKNQAPLVDMDRKAEIMLIGVSSKIKKYDGEVPLDPRTRSGKLVEQMETIARRYDWNIYRTNLVKCPPVGDDGKLRYPEEDEISACFGHILNEMKAVDPQLVFMLGNIVIKAMQGKWQLREKKKISSGLSSYQCDGRVFIASYHPSYILRSTQRTEDYLQNFEQLITFTKEGI